MLKHKMITDVKSNGYLCVIDNLLSPDECKNLIHRCNTVKNNDGNLSWHHPKTGGKYMRAIIIDQQMADELFSRIISLLPETYNRHKLLYLNSHFRFSRYNTGGQFPMHRDGTNYDNDRHEEFGTHTRNLYFKYFS